MALTQIERAILVAARVYLADKREERICHAINRASDMVMNSAPKDRHPAISDAGCRLRIFIMRAIAEPSGESRFGFEDWLAAEIGEQVYDTPAREYLPKLRRSRIAWIDWLLDEPWTDHNGGPQPLLPHEKVIIRKRNGEVTQPRPADSVRWYNATALPGLHSAEATQYDCVAYKVIYEAPTC